MVQAPAHNHHTHTHTRITNNIKYNKNIQYNNLFKKWINELNKINIDEVTGNGRCNFINPNLHL